MQNIAYIYNVGVVLIRQFQYAFVLLAGIYYAMGVVGPALAAFGSAFLLGLYTDFLSLDPKQ